MRNLLLFTTSAIMMGSVALAADSYEIDPSHTSVVWSASHLGFSDSLGFFPGVSGTFTLDEENPANSNVEVEIELASISTGIPKFDAHLKNEDFFNVEKYTTATFKSTDIKVTGEKTAVITGELSMLGKTAPLELEATLNKIGENPFNNKQVAGFSLRGTVYRSKYGINYALPAVPDSVDLIIEAEGIKAE
tara:strand:+ start:719 stop:1291 length:573 start_codon:yes stop_codon:yes gene_type:complete